MNNDSDFPKFGKGVPIIEGPRLKNAFAVLVMVYDPETYKPYRVIKANDELHALAKRYNLLMFPGAEQGPVFQKARTELTQKLRVQFYKIVAPFNKAVDQDERDRIEDALWQHRVHAADETLPYRAYQANSIENELHPFSTKKGWDHRRLLNYIKSRKIISLGIQSRIKRGLARPSTCSRQYATLKAATFTRESEINRRS